VIGGDGLLKPTPFRSLARVGLVRVVAAAAEKKSGTSGVRKLRRNM